MAIAQTRINNANLSNVRLFEADIESFDELFDLGISLHACGSATDVVIQK